MCISDINIKAFLIYFHIDFKLREKLSSLLYNEKSTQNKFNIRLLKVTKTLVT